MTATEPQTKTPLLAWEVELRSHICIVFAATKSKAQWIATKAYWEAYGNNEGWPRAVAFRRPDLDNSKLRFDQPRAYGPEYV